MYALSIQLGILSHCRPSSLDALVFGYLAPLLKLPLPDDRLQQHIKACPNLVRFVDSLISIYMPLTDEGESFFGTYSTAFPNASRISEMTTQRLELKEWEKRKEKAQLELQRMRRKEKEDKEHATSEDEFPLRHKIMFAVGALVLSLFIAVHTGLIQVLF